MPAPFLNDLALSTIEALQLMIPGPFREATVGLKSFGPNQLVVEKLETKVEGTFDRPAGEQAIRDMTDVTTWAGAVNAGFSRLQEELPHRTGESWDGASARVRFGDGGAALALGERVELEVSAELWAERLVTDALGQLLAATLPAATARQNRLAARLEGLQRWNWNGESGRLELALPGGPLTLHSAAIGSFAEGDHTWLWAWANQSIPPQAVEHVAALREAATAPGLGALRRPGLLCDADFAFRLALFAGAKIGAAAVFPAATRGMKVFFGVLE